MTADITTSFVRTLADEWVRAGVRHAVIAPGSRSTPLALALMDRPEIDVQVVIDERSAAFRALGIGKATGQPAILLCTSGSAATHFAPAVVEADAARVPMIVCTADRPPELHDVGAPQTIDQQFLYGRAVRWFVDPGVPTEIVDADAVWRTLADRLVDVARGDGVHAAGPVHCNLAFREPLVPTGDPLLDTPGRADGERWVTTIAPAVSVDTASVDAIVAAVRANPHGIILAGWGADVAPDTMRRFARVAGWPVLADTISQLRTGDHALGAYEALVRAPGFGDAHRPTVALRVGAPITSKVTNQWLDVGVPQLLIDPLDTWSDPVRAAMTRVGASANAALAAAATELEAHPLNDRDVRLRWFQQWRDADSAARLSIDKLLESWDEPFEGRIARDAFAATPEGGMFFVASSMPVRDLEWFAGERNAVAVHASRGTNGIDGFVSTVVGLATASDAPVVGLCGDLAYLHDSNGLLGLEHRRDFNAVIVVSDNDGGGIFSFLPQAELPAHFEELWGTPHGRDLGALTAAYGIVFSHVNDAADLQPAIASGLRDGGLHVVLVKTDRADNVTRHREVWDVAARALSGGQ